MQKEISTEWPIEDKFGVCRLSLVSLYQEPRNGSGLVSQLLFGETYAVLAVSTDQKWLLIQPFQENFKAWIRLDQHQILSENEFLVYSQPGQQLTVSPISYLRTKENLIYLLPGSQLPSSGNELFDLEEMLNFEGETRDTSQKADREELLKIARLFLNAPHLSGGRSLFGLGSGGFIQLVFKIAGYKAPRFFSQWLDYGKKIDLSEMQKGDVVIFSNALGIPFHAGIFVGEKEIIHVKGRVMIENIPILGPGNFPNKTPYSGVFGIRNLF